MLNFLIIWIFAPKTNKLTIEYFSVNIQISTLRSQFWENETFKSNFQTLCFCCLDIPQLFELTLNK